MLVRTDRIGDVLLTLPMAEALRGQYPEAGIDLLVNKRVYELVCDYPNINKVHSIEKVSTKAVFDVCREGRYDLAIIVYPTFEVAYGVYKAGVKYRLGTAYRWYSFLFNLKHRQHRKDSIKHESSYNLDLLNELNIYTDKRLVTQLQVSDEQIRCTIDKLQGIGLDITMPYIVIHIPSLGSARVWSDENFRKLLELILRDVNICYNVVLTGTESDISQVKGIVDKLPQNSRIYCIFSLNLKELAAVISRAALFVSNSTGPIHIAAAVGTYVVGLYSPVRVESAVRWAPLTAKKKIFQPESDKKDIDVMNEISPLQVYDLSLI
ncbi:MAG: glycosyltransferase family 9 protein, partial [Ignavibacteria bacterium]|nr:glycosyltransferase family 9 protein [Ignavibacteria bacterium]